MGLDMYLTKKTYIGAEYKHRNVKGSIKITSGKDNTVVPIQFKRISLIEEGVGYWRKANHIHAWFVKHVQDDEDDCKEYTVSKLQLQQLLVDCTAVKKSSKLATEILPTQPGFFFGGTDYDEYYMRDIDDTIKIIKPLLKELSGDLEHESTIIYQSSW